MDEEISVVTASSILEKLPGATISAAFVEDENGLHIVMNDGRVLIIAGVFAVSLSRFDREKLH